MRLDRRAFLAAAAGGLAGCASVRPPDRPGSALDHDPASWASFDPDWQAPTPSPGTVEPEVVVENLEIPWDIAFAPTGELFVTERTGRVLRVADDSVTTLAEPADAIDAEAVPTDVDDHGWWVEGGEGGVLGVAVHPLYPDAPYVYVYYTRPTRGGKANRVSRFDATADDPARTEEVLVDGIPAGGVHNGGRIAFGPDDFLWITTGDAGEPALAQDGESLAGKVLRVRPSGRPPFANPGVPARDRRVYSLGHRNPQGLAWLPDATPVITEHGPDGHDEISRLAAGANYGWPNARTEAEYDGTDYERPLVNTPADGSSWAPTGCTFYTGDRVPSWRNRLVFGALFGQRVHVVTLTPPDETAPPGGKRFDAPWLDDSYVATSHRRLDGVLGRVRHVAQGPDGHLYAITSNRDGRARREFPTERDDVLVRLRPA